MVAGAGFEGLVAGLSPLQLAGVGAAGFAGATLAAVSGFGGAAVLLPVLVAAFGPRLAVPILTVAQLIGNGSRVWLNRRELDYRVVGWFALGGVPTAILGSLLFARAPLHALTRLIGAFLLLIVAWRRFVPRCSGVRRSGRSAESARSRVFFLHWLAA